MRERPLEHDAVPVHLTDGWVAICATCGWVGENRGSKPVAAKDAEQHVLQAKRADSPATDPAQ